MKVTARFFGVPRLSPERRELRLREGTVDEARNSLVDLCPDLVAVDGTLLAFVNGTVVAKEKWGDALLKDGDALMLVVPIAGG